MALLKRTNPRRSRLRKSMTAAQPSVLSRLFDADVITSVLLGVFFVMVCVPVVSFDLFLKGDYAAIPPVGSMVVLLVLGASVYIQQYQKRITRNHARAMALLALFVLLLAATKFGTLLTDHDSWPVATAVIAAIILTIAYDQRFALGMGMFYVAFAWLAGGSQVDAGRILTMTAGVFTCCFSLREIRTRMKLLETAALAGIVVFTTSMACNFIISSRSVADVFVTAAYEALGVFIAGMVIQSLLPVIERTFKIATSMTLLDYSDANQPLLKRLAMEAPGTFSHSLLIGSIAEGAAEAIGRNGLLARVGAYYHDIGKINKPGYFVENEMGSKSRHEELSPAMSQLVIVGHVKDGIELAREYGLPAVLRQFIETHHGTTLVEFFYDKARKQHANAAASQAEKDDGHGDSSARGQEAQRPSQGGRVTEPAESAFRYAGPKPKTKEGAIVMLADSVEGAVRSLLPDVTPAKIETVVHQMAMKRLQDGQFDECDLTLRELSRIESSISKTLIGHYHSRIAYPVQQQ